MIRVRFHTGPGGRFSGVDVEGHAGLAEAGSDIVCAAASVLAENLGESLRQLLQLPAEIRKEKGAYSLRLMDSETGVDTELLFASAALGMAVLSRQYPDRVQLETGEAGALPGS